MAIKIHSVKQNTGEINSIVGAYTRPTHSNTLQHQRKFRRKPPSSDPLLELTVGGVLVLDVLRSESEIFESFAPVPMRVKPVFLNEQMNTASRTSEFVKS